MIDPPQIVATAAQMTACIHLTIPRSEVVKVIGPGLSELQSAIAAQGIAATGPWFTHHLRMEPNVFDFEICIPIAEPVIAVGRVKPGELPAAIVARTIYRGPYQGLGAAWGEFSNWIAANGYSTALGLWERYVAGPESSPDPADWQTELNRPLMD